MRKAEQKLWDRMRKNLKSPELQLVRIENLVGVGAPDVDAIHKSVITKMELKAVKKLPKRDTTPVLGAAAGLSAQQKNWHLEWRRHGGRSLIIVGVDSFQFYAIEGKHHDSINDMTHTDLAANSVADDWDSLAIYLRTAA
jgi:hypothetical protein